MCQALLKSLGNVAVNQKNHCLKVQMEENWLMSESKYLCNFSE